MRKPIGKCKLCYENKVLIKGHILPNWGSKLSGKASTYFIATQDIASLQISTLNKSPQGLTAEYLFCEECDNSFGVGEGLLREMVHPSTKKSSSISNIKDFRIELNGEKAIKDLYLALGGLLLKPHISEQNSWKDFFLNKKQRDLVVTGIKNASLSQNFEVSIFKLYNLDNFKIGNFTDKDERINQALPSDFQFYAGPYLIEYGKFSTIFAFGGLILMITFHPKGYATPDLSQDTLKMHIVPLDIRYLFIEEGFLGVGHLFDVLTDYKFVTLVNTIKNTPLSSKCPCKVTYTNNGVKENRSFGDCCHKYWGYDRLQTK